MLFDFDKVAKQWNSKKNINHRIEYWQNVTNEGILLKGPNCGIPAANNLPKCLKQTDFTALLLVFDTAKPLFLRWAWWSTVEPCFKEDRYNKMSGGGGGGGDSDTFPPMG